MTTRDPKDSDMVLIDTVTVEPENISDDRKHVANGAPWPSRVDYEAFMVDAR